MYKILLVEDVSSIHTLVAAALGANYLVTNAPSLAEGWRWVCESRFNLILLDVELPDGNGFNFLTRLLGDERTEAVPVMFLTGKGKVDDQVMGFSLGAEDYITKPFDPLELRARVDARLRKIERSIAQNEVFRKDDLRFDLSAFKAFVSSPVGERELDLTPSEFRLLLHFAHHEGHVLSREQLLAAVCDSPLMVTDRTVDVHISHLRKKMGVCSFAITSVHRTGYRFTKKN